MSTTPLNVPIPSISALVQSAAALLQDSLAQAHATSTASLSATDLALARSNIKALSFVQAVGLHGAYRYLRDFIARQAIPIKAVDEFLDGWLETYGMPRKEATTATRRLSGTGIDGVQLDVGTLLQAENGQQFSVTTGGTVVDGIIVVDVVALLAGTAANLASGASVSLVAAVPGIDSGFAVVPDSGRDGTDRETDTEAIYRLQQRLSSEPMGGAPADYARWALQLPGITRAWGVRNPAGPTSAGVIIMADGNVPPGLPTVGQRELVRAYIEDPERGPPDELLVIVPDPVLIDLVIKLDPDTPAIRAEATLELQDLFFREAAPGGSIPHAHLVEAISGVSGEYNHQITEPAITSGGMLTVDRYDQLLVLNSVEFV